MIEIDHKQNVIHRLKLVWKKEKKDFEQYYDFRVNWWVSRQNYSFTSTQKSMHCVKRKTNVKKELMHDPTRTRTWNLLIRSQTPYPLGHEAKTFLDEFPLLFDNREVQIPTVLCFLTCLQFMLGSRSTLWQAYTSSMDSVWTWPK